MRKLALSSALALLGASLALTPAGAVRRTEDAISFKKDVAPIFKASCVKCHNADRPAAGLDLSTVDGIKKGGSHGKVFVAGKPDKSILIKAITPRDNGSAYMPRGAKALEAKQIKLLTQWITEGPKLDN